MEREGERVFGNHLWRDSFLRIPWPYDMAHVYMFRILRWRPPHIQCHESHIKTGFYTVLQNIMMVTMLMKLIASIDWWWYTCKWSLWSSWTSCTYFETSCVLFDCLFVCCYKPRKSLLRLPPLARSKPPGSISTRAAYLFLRSYRRHTTARRHFTCQLRWTLRKLSTNTQGSQGERKGEGATHERFGS